MSGRLVGRFLFQVHTSFHYFSDCVFNFKSVFKIVACS